MNRAVLTIATGKPVYIQLATNFIRSFKWWHKNSDIRCILATDQKALLPKDLSDIEVIDLKPGQLGQGFSPKLHLDKLALAKQTMFIDADCLCTGPLEFAFNRFSGRAVSAVGKSISDGEWFGNIPKILSQFSLKEMPRFNGGLYYIERGEISRKVYQTARNLELRYDDIGFKRLRGRPNDEVLMSLAMAIYGQTPVIEDGTIMNSTLAAPGGVEIDVFSGYSKLKNPLFHPNHNPWYEQEEMSPKIVHFLSSETESAPYVIEQKKLELTSLRRWPIWLAQLQTNLLISLPSRLSDLVKRFLRPFYHKLFGPRTIKKSTRT